MKTSLPCSCLLATNRPAINSLNLDYLSVIYDQLSTAFKKNL